MTKGEKNRVVLECDKCGKRTRHAGHFMRPHDWGCSDTQNPGTIRMTTAEPSRARSAP